jgi:hypothetical protein
MAQYYVWERCVYKGDTITAPSIYMAVSQFADAPVLPLSSAQYMACGTGKSNPARFITADGSAREFVAYEIPAPSQFANPEWIAKR